MLARMDETLTFSDDEELELLERARGGDRQAFDQLVRASLDRVWGVVWRILRHKEDTEDVVQEVFIAAYQALPSFRGEARVSTWLHRIAVTRSLNHLDRAAEKLRRAASPIDAADSGGVPEDVVSRTRTTRTPLEDLEASELMRRLQECVAALPGAWRAALALRETQRQSYQDMARLLSVAVGTVRSRLARARDALKTCIEGPTP